MALSRGHKIRPVEISAEVVTVIAAKVIHDAFLHEPAVAHRRNRSEVGKRHHRAHKKCRKLLSTKYAGPLNERRRQGHR